MTDGAESRRSRDELIATLASRIESCLRTGPQAVLDPEALDEARQLAALVGSRYTCDAEAVMLLAAFHMHRWRALPPGKDRWDEDQMAAWLAVAGRIDPRLVPPPLRTMVPESAQELDMLNVAALNAQAAALMTHFENTGNADLLRRGIAAWQQGLDGLRCDQQAPRAGILINLSGALIRRAEITRNMEEADEAAAAAREAVRITPHAHELHGRALAHLGIALQTRYELFGDNADLTEAITAGRAATGPEYQASAGRCKSLANLANTLRISFQATGRLADLDDAVALNREALAIASPDETLVIQSNLSGVLLLRFEETLEEDDIEDAEYLSRLVVKATPAGRPERAGRLYNLGQALLTRAVLRVKPGDVTKIVQIAREAVTAASSDHHDKATYQNNLVAALRFRVVTASALGTLTPGQRDSDLAEMIETARASVELTPEGHPDRASYLNNLGIVLRMRERPQDLDEAVTAAQEAVDATPEEHYNWCPHMTNLGNALEARFRRTREIADFTAAISAWANAARSETGASQDRLAAAIAWGRLAAAEKDAANAADGFGYGVSLLPLVAWRGLERGAQEENLARWQGIASDAAAWAIRNQEPERAIELLEHGRSVLWTQQLDLRTETNRLAARAPELHKAIEDTRRALDSTGRHRDLFSGGASSGPTPAQRRRLTERWDLLVAQARRLPGFADFLAPVPFRKLRQAAVDGPVAIVNTSSYGSEVLVINGKSVLVIPLPAVNHNEVVDRAKAMLAVLGRVATRSAHADVDEQIARAAKLLTDVDDMLADVLAWLWTAVACPLLKALQITERLGSTDRDTSRARRLWWCPAGAFAMLPLHAAGLRSAENASVADRVISSYTSTLGALVRSRQPSAPRTKPPLVVGVSNAPGQPPLPFVAAELERISKYITPVTMLTNEHATREDVLKAMADHGWVHFACHGRQNDYNPVDSSLWLFDGPLSVDAIAEREQADRELAYLSACETSTGVPQLADEAIHLAAAFQAVGYRHVIASLWGISDPIAPVVADTVYQALCRDGIPCSAQAAEAIHHAVTRLRDHYPDHPHLWASYIHIGP
ncbi:MAG TPA: CHAT domain-containing protein [Streptosporangiaceae bacterium]|nr:CHAT domain-containing protein [Streptosporangiaceae bacterium]